MGVVCHDLIHDEEVQILADMVVNASGAWAGQIASLAGLTVSVIPGKGTMLAMNHRIVNTVINRCKMPADGDILVPSHTVSVIGTTDVKVEDPDHFAIEPWEIELMLDEGEKLSTGLQGYACFTSLGWCPSSLSRDHLCRIPGCNPCFCLAGSRKKRWLCVVSSRLRVENGPLIVRWLR